MPRKRDSPEQMITKLRQAEVELSRGLRAPQVCKKLGVSEQTYDRLAQGVRGPAVRPSEAAEDARARARAAEAAGGGSGAG